MGDSYLFCLDLYTGQKLWQKPFNAQWETYLHPLVIGGSVYIEGGRDGGLYVFNAFDGSETAVWSDSFTSNWAPSYADNKIYTWVGGNFTARNPIDGRPSWQLKLPLSTEFTWLEMNAAPVIENQTAFVMSSLALSAINLDTHTLKWSVSEIHIVGTQPAVADGVVYTINGKVLEARSSATGDLLGSYTAPSDLLYSPVFTRTSVYIATASTTYMLDRASLKVKWSAREGGWLTLADGYLFIAGYNGVISAYRAERP